MADIVQPLGSSPQMELAKNFNHLSLKTNDIFKIGKNLIVK